MNNQYQAVFDDLKDSIDWLAEIVRQLKQRKAKRETVSASGATDIEKANLYREFDVFDKMNFESIQDLLKLLKSLLHELSDLTSVDE